jgi:hypothetical protein
MTEKIKPLPCIVLGVRSKEEEEGKDSAGDQVKIVSAHALRQGDGRFIHAQFTDHGSGFRGNRGEDTQRAIESAKRAADEYERGAELWLFKSERIGRGSGRKNEARSVMEAFVDLRRAGVQLRSMEDDVYFTNPMLIGVADAMAHKYAEDLSSHVKRGLTYRKEVEGKPVGSIPQGYEPVPMMVDGKPLMRRNKIVTERVINLKEAAIVEEIFEMADTDPKPGMIARHLTAKGLTTRPRAGRARPFGRESVRKILENPVYMGLNGYPQIIEPEVWQRVNDKLHRDDPVATKQRQGGRPGELPFPLRGIAFCGRCGAGMHTRTLKRADGSRRRFYACQERRRGSGVCEASHIPAGVVEEHVLSHLEVFVGEVEAWLADLVAGKEDERKNHVGALERARDGLAHLHRQRDKHFASYRRMVDDDDDPLARYALEEVARIDAQIADQEHTIAQTQARVSEWEGAPDVDDMLDLYSELVALMRGNLALREGAAPHVKGLERERAEIQQEAANALNAALRGILRGIWMSVEDRKIRCEFRMLPGKASPALMRAVAAEDPFRPPIKHGNRLRYAPTTVDLTLAKLSNTPRFSRWRARCSRSLRSRGAPCASA